MPIILNFYKKREGVEMGKLSNIGAAFAVVGALGGVVYAAYETNERWKAEDLDNQERFYAEPRVAPADSLPYTVSSDEEDADPSARYGDGIVYSQDCADKGNGAFVVVSGDELVEAPEGGSITAVFSEQTLPDAVPDALGHCDVTVTGADGAVVDTYEVNAYKPQMLQFFAN